MSHNLRQYVMAPLDPGSKKEEELETGLSNGDGMSPVECLERPGAEDNAIPGLLGHWGKWLTGWEGACPHRHRGVFSCR